MTRRRDHAPPSEDAATEPPTVSIIVPAHNAADYLEATVTGLLGQTFASTEVIVVDDGSTDATAVVARRLADQHPRVHFLWQPFNVGVARARERAVRHARGAYLWFVDADDRPVTDAVSRLVSAARRTDADVVICGAEFVYPDGHTRALRAPQLPVPVSGETAFRMLLLGDISGHLWNKLFRRTLAERIDFTAARVHSDLAMTAQLLAAARQVAAIPDMLYSYIQRPGSILRSGTRRLESLELVERAVRDAAGTLDPHLLRSRPYRYFELRFIALSGLKDVVTGPYDRAERTALVATLRRRVGLNTFVDLVVSRDWKRLLLAASAKLSVGLHRLVLRFAGADERLPAAGHPTDSARHRAV
ncbi:glycosyltransferase family 2 protein [Glaciibacter sp. 2TAF33]|uniref:glycosyltransferase family 2 protein n=1 Tax=Glaciibacter sp. 2TAF33 TaxID=3233015 RepID=UPI003F8E40C4